MAVSLTVNGIAYNYPSVTSPPDKKWGAAATGWAQGVTAAISHLRGPTLPIADEGQIRLGNTDSIAWRDFGNTQNLRIYADVDDKLYYQAGAGTPIDLVAAAGGNVTGPGVSTDRAVPRFDGVSGQLLLDSGVILSDTDDLTVPGDLSAASLDTDSITLGSGNIDLEKALVPIGTIIHFYDFNGDLTLDSTYWKPCDGGNYTIGGSTRTTPDLSGRYIVGFGTDGGGDNDSAAWDTAPVGNAGHTINIQHSHTVNSHTHSIPANIGHSHTVNSHFHLPGSLTANIEITNSNSRINTEQVTAPASWVSTNRLAGSGDTAGQTLTNGVAIQGQTFTSSPGTDTQGAHDHGGTSGGSSPGTNNQLSTTQSIQPRSIRVRFYMRAK